jgi:putative acetyltransferase
MLWLITRVETDPNYLGALLPAIVLIGIGSGVGFSVAISGTMIQVPPNRFAQAGAGRQTVFQTALALGIAIAVALLSAAGSDELVSGFRHTWWLSFGGIVATVLTFTLLYPPRSDTRPPAAELVFDVEDPLVADVQSVIKTHLAFSRAITPPEDVHALSLDGLGADPVTLFTARSQGRLRAVGALRRLDDDHVEIKSMHTLESARGRGVGRAMLDYLTEAAIERGYRRMSLETGMMDEMAPARAMYESAGFTRCEPFGEYQNKANSVCMTKTLDV